ncbi:hypothetical protein KM043_014215 [Ampulex compressa]|nr:hypothetical protein KM043_014215 [Ampulex compressa]
MINERRHRSNNYTSIHVQQCGNRYEASTSLSPRLLFLHRLRTPICTAVYKGRCLPGTMCPRSMMSTVTRGAPHGSALQDPRILSRRASWRDETSPDLTADSVDYQSWDQTTPLPRREEDRRF